MNQSENIKTRLNFHIKVIFNGFLPFPVEKSCFRAEFREKNLKPGRKSAPRGGPAGAPRSGAPESAPPRGSPVWAFFAKKLEIK